MTVDLRNKVEDDRGLIKKIQLCIPGFRGYRQKEDIRLADALLRQQLADELKNNVLLPLEQTRESASRALELDLMNDLAAVISQAKTAEAKIRHAEQGYTGVSPANRIKKAELNTLYEYDLALIDGIRGLGDLAKAAFSSADAGSFDSVKEKIREIRSGFSEFTVMFDKRSVEIAGIGAF
ncbi:MAG: hypothetical protein Q7J08_07995 [Methanocorpusculum sp.]|jgi:hypothetical protein|uniref:hypothetical protein n=1 Tax=Methanocorpusculum sp. TaxID=2058474 RepID=UPI0027258B8E|nr:hypothetical protein [Methanocorpusculum sp.]MDO9523633.1 hypothetical protein [Methanocorpusculum sp.]